MPTTPPDLWRRLHPPATPETLARELLAEVMHLSGAHAISLYRPGCRDPWLHLGHPTRQPPAHTPAKAPEPTLRLELAPFGIPLGQLQLDGAKPHLSATDPALGPLLLGLAFCLQRPTRPDSPAAGDSPIIGDSPPMRALFQTLDRLKRVDLPVLISGESGVGKEVVARHLHTGSARADGPFIPVNCGAIPAELIESALFGHVRGAFTHAISDHDGYFRAADGGTLFLDEIGDLPYDAQVKLLRALQESEIQPVGSQETLPVNVRILAASHHNLESLVRQGRFREDLYYRLAVIPVEIPPLRERGIDIALLSQHFIDRSRALGLGTATGLSPETQGALNRYHWPGNVRQLEAVIQNAMLFGDGPLLGPKAFSNHPEILGHAPRDPETPDRTLDRQAPQLVGLSLRELEKIAIIQTLISLDGNKKRTAERLGISRRTLYTKLEVYEIDADALLDEKA